MACERVKPNYNGSCHVNGKNNRMEENNFLAAQGMQTEGVTLVNGSRMKDVLFRALKGCSDP